MYTMSQINHIKDLSNCGYRISEISKKTGADPKTIRKYLSQEYFSPVPPVVQTQPSKLDPFKPVIQEWLDEDKKHWRKQNHTVQRIYERLVEEQGYTGSYSVVQRYLKKCRSVQTEKANLELVWDPGPAQVDFGEADFYESGKLIRKKYLTLSFPYSNDVSDYTTTLAVLMKNSGAWGNSGLRQETPDALRTYMDAQPKEKLKDCLRIMNELTNQYGFQAAASAMEMACARGNINICDASVLAARITGYGISTPPEAGPSLEIYDEAFLKGGSKAL